MKPHKINNIGRFNSDGTLLVGNSISIGGNAYFDRQEAVETCWVDTYHVLLDALAFNRMNDRQRNIALALPDTCQWLQNHQQFQIWMDLDQLEEHGNIIWIKGKPGSGKSTIMKMIVTWAQKAWPDQIVLTYFFNARSPNRLERSSLGLYRSLVHQLLMAHPLSQPIFVTKFASKVRAKEMVEDWTLVELQNFLVEVITARPQIRSISIFIDALDEGEADDTRHVVASLERLVRFTASEGVPIRLCFASRHYPHITVRNGLILELEDQVEHERDIDCYIRSQLRVENTFQEDTLIRCVKDRSAGIFLWVVLVVLQLNKTFDKGRRMHDIFRIVDETPQDLHDVFTTIINQNSEDIVECIVALRWVLFALKPLQPKELYAAIHVSSGGSIANSNTPSDEVVARHLLHCSRGLIELTKTEPVTVQFIHETVRDFLMGMSTHASHSTPYHDIANPSTCFQNGACHMLLAEECLQHLLQLEEPASTETEWSPLALYAAEHWWQHVRSSHQACSPRLLELTELLISNHHHMLTWARHWNIDYEISGYDAFVETTLAPPLYYMAWTGIVEVLQQVLDRGADIDAEGGLYGTALHAASIEGQALAVKILLKHGADVNAHDREHGTALHLASEEGHLEIARMLLDYGAEVNAEGGRFGTSLWAASAHGHEEVVAMLLKHGANVNRQGGKSQRYYSTALQAASEHGEAGIVKLLLDHGANANILGGGYGTALQAASEEGHAQIVEMLLKHGAHVDTDGGEFGTALQVTSKHYSPEIEQLLRRYGAQSGGTRSWQCCLPGR